MEEIETQLAKRALELLRKLQRRVLIALAGSPGSGKSTISYNIISKINELAGKEIAVVVTQDGFHYYRSELEKFPNSVEAFSRRGAPFTFNVQQFYSLVKILQSLPSTTAPSFDHALKDPLENAITILPRHKIVIIEGNYILLKDPAWKDIGNLTDEKWEIQVPWEIARERIAHRHLKAGIVNTLEEGYERTDNNDLKNTIYIKDNSVVSDVSIKSIEVKQAF